jgi:hypothetical protein
VAGSAAYRVRDAAQQAVAQLRGLLALQTPHKIQRLDLNCRARNAFGMRAGNVGERRFLSPFQVGVRLAV